MRLLFAALGLAMLSPLPGLAAEILAPKVMVITMFDAEAAPWLSNLDLPQQIAVPGLHADFGKVSCGDDLCVMTTGMGYANAATSTLAVALSDRFDLKQTYFLIAGIAGVDPQNGTLGGAAWADYVVDAGLVHRIDSREAPSTWKSQIVELGAGTPGEVPAWSAGTETFRLDPALVKFAYEASKDVALADSPEAAAWRAAYAQPAAKAPPSVMVCASVSADTYWHGGILAREIADHTALLTQGRADYCMSQMEDNATLTALSRAAGAGRLDMARVAVLRTASNFDRPHEDLTAADSLAASSGGFGPAVENAFRIGNAFAQGLISAWGQVADGITD